MAQQPTKSLPQILDGMSELQRRIIAEGVATMDRYSAKPVLKDGKAFYVRDKVRNLAKYMVQIGGVTIIDALDEPDLRELVTDKIEQLTAA